MPKIWKALGDEIIFVVEITKSHEPDLYVNGLRRALSKWNEVGLEPGSTTRLRVKGAAWTAGFPVCNTILTLHGKQEDFVGPSMDIGFRVAERATVYRMALSVDLAWLLSVAPGDGRMMIRFDGVNLLKGMGDSVGYPCLWIEVGDSEYLAAERRLLGYGDQERAGQIQQLCEHYLLEFGIPRHLPFLYSEPGLSAKPKDYDEHHAVAVERLRKHLMPEGEEAGGKEPRSSETKGRLRRLETLAVEGRGGGS